MNAQSYDWTKTKQESASILRRLQKDHVSMRICNNNYSHDVFDELISMLDPHSLYFNKQDILSLDSARNQIDNDLNSTQLTALLAITKVYKHCLERSQSIINGSVLTLAAKNKKEYIHFEHYEPLVPASNEPALTAKWHKWLKYQVLEDLSTQLGDTVPIPQDQSKKELASIKKVQAAALRKISNIIDHPLGFENYVSNHFLNAILSCQDPHSYYLSPTDYQNMQANLSPNGLSFGIDFEEDDIGNIKIARLQPGGPGWKSNLLHKGDLLLQLKWEGKKEIDLDGSSLNELHHILSSSNNTKALFTVRKTSGLVKSVELSKEVLDQNQNIVRSYLLESDKKIGYISLPGFYGDWGTNDGLGCANDVAKEIFKLQKEGIDGLLLDLRYNGGGALLEGRDLAGIFINEGVLAYLDDKSHKPFAMKDANRGTAYEGPLVVLVNKQSASASEIVAAALQDYQRAVIVGTTTYGKGSGQSIIPLDSTPTMNKNLLQSPSSGIAAVTSFKLYRPTGKSVQKSGLKPDIVLPDLYDWIEFGEQNYALALNRDSINKKIYTPLYPLLPIQNLAEKSKNRIAKEKYFQMININDPSCNPIGLIQADSIMLELNSYRKHRKNQNAWWNELENQAKLTPSLFKIQNTKLDENVIKMDTYSGEINDASIKHLKTDPYLKESFLIIKDLINFDQK